MDIKHQKETWSNFTKLVTIGTLAVILILVLILRIWKNVHLLWLLLVALARHYNRVWHVGAVFLWNNILTWVKHYHLLILILVIKWFVLARSLLMHLLWNIHFFGGLHLWHSNELEPWDAVILLDWLHWHGIAIGIWRALVGYASLELLAWLLDVLVLTISLRKMNILWFRALHRFLVLFQKLSWWEVLSHDEAAIGATRSTFRSTETLWAQFFNWIILLNMILLINLGPILIYD